MRFHRVNLIFNVGLDCKSHNNTKKNGFRLLPASNDVHKAVHECVQDDEPESQEHNPYVNFVMVSLAILFHTKTRVRNCIKSFGILS
jgi:hypothetical protein